MIIFNLYIFLFLIKKKNILEIQHFKFINNFNLFKELHYLIKSMLLECCKQHLNDFVSGSCDE